MSPSLLPLLQLAALGWIFLAPGVLLVRAVRAPWTRGERLLVGASLGMLLVPMLCFCVACVARTSITPALALGVATAVNVGAIGVGVIRGRR